MDSPIFECKYGWTVFFLSSFNGSMLEQYNVCNKRIQITHTHTTFKGHSRKRIEKNEWVIINIMIRHKNFRGFIWFIHAIRVFSRTFGFLNKTRSQRSNNKQSEGENRLSKHNIILLKIYTVKQTISKWFSYFSHLAQ